MPANVEAKIEWLVGQIWSREQWLHDHASKWPTHDVEAKQHGLSMLQDIHDDYAKSLARAKERAGE